jgi:hypothetical protein
MGGNIEIHYTLSNHTFGGVEIGIFFQIGQRIALKNLSKQSVCLSRRAMDFGVVADGSGNGSRQMPRHDWAVFAPGFAHVSRRFSA